MRPLPIRTLLLWISLALAASGPLRADSFLWKQHQEVAVTWQKWGPGAIETAQATGKPLFFFVAHYGNSLARAMLHETFQNPSIAETLNQTALPVLVDTSEQAELASFLQALAFQHFETSELPICLWTDASLAPLNGGGYFPPTDDWGGQGFLSLAKNVHEQWESSRDDFASVARFRLQQTLERQALSPGDIEPRAARFTPQPFLPSDSPKLPAIDFYNYARILDHLPNQESARLQKTMEDALHRIVYGAGFDGISGGFFAGSNDRNWRLPLFQKYTSDQALMVISLSLLHARIPKPEYEKLIEQTLLFIEESLTEANGNALQLLDSFAPGETPEATEGSYYLISGAEAASLSPETRDLWGLAESGNLDQEVDVIGLYPGQNVPYATSPAAYSTQSSTAKELRDIRASKPFPRADQTGYTATNALVVRAYAAAARSLGSERYLEHAKRRFATLLENNADPQARLLFNSDARGEAANSLDYSLLIAAALNLETATGDPAYRASALAWLETWKSDPRFLPALPIARLSGQDGLNFAIYEDSRIPSAAATQLANLLQLEGPGSPSISALLASAPKSFQRHPERYRGLVLPSADEAEAENTAP